MIISTLACNFSLKTTSISRHRVVSHQKTLSSFPLKIQAFNLKPSLSSLTLSGKRLGLSRNGKSEFYVNAGNGGEGGGVDEAERLARGESTMPERFRYLTKEAPDPPVRWPFFVGELLSALMKHFKFYISVNCIITENPIKNYYRKILAYNQPEFSLNHDIFVEAEGADLDSLTYCSILKNNLWCFCSHPPVVSRKLSAMKLNIFS